MAADLLWLMSNATRLKRVAATGGGEYAGPCPFCGGTDRLRVWPRGERGRWWCRRCLRSGDAITFLREYEGLSLCRLAYRDHGRRMRLQAYVVGGRSLRRHAYPTPSDLYTTSYRDMHGSAAWWAERARRRKRLYYAVLPVAGIVLSSTCVLGGSSSW